VKILNQSFQTAVTVFGFSEVRLAVEVDVAKNAFELALVALFYVVENDIDQLADIGG